MATDGPAESGAHHREERRTALGGECCRSAICFAQGEGMGKDGIGKGNFIFSLTFLLKTIILIDVVSSA